ncbi:methyltransferase family protein [Azotobacter chroococcum]|uniref:Protein-S-isoprenylcysteine O-methyltransferase Ste14 n=1 Tax=Azotobacter chroococcum TaxID=353 RepID=A0A4R1PQ96_9GAMM|nr:isoprenylcysteine carboxylmethyltransferase family protein [Azotobacter chroococcum]TBV94608.1 isoprenylcysteine carboxylmethyltransferase family protein [Azotobacter chroococcum]TCL33713.1 protein-S-isoprenylcysteine O-methyltransferase Ste14 [Azotobacter chroococcum]
MPMRPRRIFLPPPVIYLLFIGLAYGLGELLPLPLTDDVWTHWAGWGLIDSGILMMLWAALQMFVQRTTVNPYGTPAKLIVSGPFRLSRNPIYLADTLIYCGIALLLASAWPWLLLPALILCMSRWVIRHEEALLSQLFGEQFEAYRARVRRWL